MIGEENMLEKEPDEKVDFETWYSMRERYIPVHHYKEILKADFAARGLRKSASLKDFDEALKKYGVKLS